MILYKNFIYRIIYKINLIPVVKTTIKQSKDKIKHKKPEQSCPGFSR
jgi:hypothetical protein